MSHNVKFSLTFNFILLIPNMKQTTNYFWVRVLIQFVVNIAMFGVCLEFLVMSSPVDIRLGISVK